MHNPYTGGEGIFIKRDVTHQKAFDKIIGNKYFSEKLSSDLSVGATSISATPNAESTPKIATRVAMISLNKRFEVEAPLLNYIWFSLKDYFNKSEFLKGYYLVGYAAIFLLTAISCHQFLFKITPSSEAKKLANLIKSDMKEKKLYRNGLSLQNIYNWYSSEINFTQPEFNAKILPHIEKALEKSVAFRKSSNRAGEAVWKLD